MKKYIIVAGNIGVGKSTLVRLLCERLGWQAYYEPEVENPYLGDFYRDMQAWAFHSQVFFLAHRMRIHLQIQRSPDSAVQDRSLYEDAEIFAQGLYLQGALSERDYATYRALYQAACDCLTPPDLMIYLRASTATLQRRIAQRRRPYEREIPLDYLERLNALYEAWVVGFTLCPVLTVPADDLDYVARPRHFELVLQKVQEKLTGKEEVRFDPAEVA